jgi:hypothetical protein
MKEIMHMFFMLADFTFRIYSVLITEAAGIAHSVGLQFLLITVPHKNVFLCVGTEVYHRCKNCI